MRAHIEYSIKRIMRIRRSSRDGVHFCIQAAGIRIVTDRAHVFIVKIYILLFCIVFDRGLRQRILNICVTRRVFHNWALIALLNRQINFDIDANHGNEWQVEVNNCREDFKRQVLIVFGVAFVQWHGSNVIVKEISPASDGYYPQKRH